MYSWGDDMENWTKPGAYKFDDARKAARDEDAKVAKAHGPRTYQDRGRPDTGITDPRKMITSLSAVPLVIAVDVTGSMQTWPREIFDRLPLLYQTLSQYSPDLEIAFAAIGDAGCDRYPLQVTDFAKGFALEDRLKALYGEGGGGDAPESYQLFAQFMSTHVRVPSLPVDGERPFLIVFGDERFHPKVLPAQVRAVLGDEVPDPLDGIDVWRAVAERWNTYFLRRPGGRKGDPIHKQWAEAIGEQKIVQIDDELRGVDYAMGLVARSWGHFADFRSNMAARQDDMSVVTLANSVLSLDLDAAGVPKRAEKKPKKLQVRDIPDTRTSPGGPEIPETRRPAAA